MAPLKKRQKKALAVAPPPPVIDAADRISKLPEEIQAQILSFLPAQEAVRTCVLARTWRDVWKLTRHLLITGKSVQEVQKFVHRLLRVCCDGLSLASLDMSEIRFDPWVEVKDGSEAYFKREDMCSINRWIRRVLKYEIQMLRVDISARTCLDVYLQISTTLVLVSRHLTRLELTGVWFIFPCISLDVCPALEHLEINGCFLEDVRKITSLSLKRLVISSCKCSGACNRIQICVPRLVSFLLHDMDFMTPLLERMPELVEAKVRIDKCWDWCSCEDSMACYHVTQALHSIYYHSDGGEVGSSDYAGQNTTKCVVLEGLAQARDLVLIADRQTYIFKRDLRWCPTFSKLKTLVLNDDYWCRPTDCSALACILEHAPILEKLTLISHQRLRSRGKYKVEMKGHPDATMKSTKISQHLEVVEIKCEDVNERFLNVLIFLDFDIRVAKNDEETTISLNW